MVDFKETAMKLLVALCAAMVSIVLWATAAWWFGIPTSESHALIAGVSGATIALQRGIGGINPGEWVKVIYGLILSVVMGFVGGALTVRLVEFIFRGFNRRKVYSVFKYAQIAGAAGMAFMHGAQDGQKFMGVFMLGVFLAQGQANATSFIIPLWLIVACSVIMALGTSVGGMRIIKSVGMDMVKLEPYQGVFRGHGGSVEPVDCKFPWASCQHDAYENNGYNGCGSSQKDNFGQLGSSERDADGMDTDISGLRPYRVFNGSTVYEDILTIQK